MLYRRFGKRILDLAIAVPAMILLYPVMLTIALVLRVSQGAPVLFRQQRPGRFGRPFAMVKFRSMRPGSEGLDDAARITRLGAFLRATSLDELPELWNVVWGDMSIVGPRPLLMSYLEHYTDEQMRRHEVRPGITGWAQVQGRQEIPFSKRFALDVWYVDNVSLWLDVRILVMTLSQVLKGRGVILGQGVDEVDDLGLSRSLEITRHGNSEQP